MKIAFLIRIWFSATKISRKSQTGSFEDENYGECVYGIAAVCAACGTDAVA
jgi:hypothetical protein